MNTKQSSPSYHQQVSENYGQVVLGMFRHLEKLKLKLARFKNHLTFLCKCKSSNIIPKFLTLKKKHFNCYKQKILLNTEKKLLSSTIKDVHIDLINLEGSIQLAEVNLKIFVSNKDYIKMIDFVKNIFNKEFNICKIRQLNKFIKLKQNQQIYLQSTNSNFTNNDLNNEEENLNFKSVINLSSKNLDNEELKLLEKGLNFSVSSFKTNNVDFVVSLEPASTFLPSEIENVYRCDVRNMIMKRKNSKSNLTYQEKMALHRLKENTNIIVLPADKGRASVVMNKIDYTNKLNDLLREGEYELINCDPTKKIQNQIKEALKNNKQFLSKKQFFELSPQFSKPPHLYGLPKIHKPNVPLRPIISSIDSPCYYLSKFLLPILTPIIGRIPSYIQNSTHFVEIIKDIHVTDSDMMTSFDVISLFTNVPINDTLRYVQELLITDTTLKDRTNIPTSNIMELLTVCLQSNYFQVDDKFYKQNNGLPMGGVLSPLLSNIFMNKFETNALATFNKKPKIWLRYIDDIFCIWSHSLEELNNFKDHINNINPTIKVTLELEQNGTLPFLDVMLTKNMNKIQTSVYRKPTNTGKYLNYQSNHAESVKFGLAYGLINRAKLLCSDENSLKAEIGRINKELINNGYPQRVINKAINHVPKTKFNDKPICTVTIPYVKGFSEKVKRINSKYGIRTTFKNKNTLRNLLSKVKPENEDIKTKNVVYKIPCSCGKNYIGQTSRPLKIRINEHKKYLEKREITKSTLCCHALEENHSINFNNTKILFKEPNWKKRCLLESAMMYLEKEPISNPSVELSSLYIPI